MVNLAWHTQRQTWGVILIAMALWQATTVSLQATTVSLQATTVSLQDAAQQGNTYPSAPTAGGLTKDDQTKDGQTAGGQTAGDWTTGIGWNSDNAIFKPASEHEGPLDASLKPAAFDSQPLFAEGRFPNLAIAMDGTVIAAWSGVQIRRSRNGGRDWEAPITVAEGFMAGGLTVDEITGDILAFVEDGHPPSELRMFRSQDQGLSWQQQPTIVHPNSLGHVPSMHMNEHGLTLRHGNFKGRLIRPSRWYGRTNYPQEFFHTHYTNAIFSDDGGRSWKASEPFPVMGTGEAGIVELSDGRLYYNTRRHWAPQSEDARWRWFGESVDGGTSWQNPQRSAVLPDGDRASSYGLMGGLVRLPVRGHDILVFSNVVSPKGRRNGFVWVSFDGGKHWPLRRKICPGRFAYSSLNAGRPGTPSEGWIYLLFEGDMSDRSEIAESGETVESKSEANSSKPVGGTICRFNLGWLLEGELTGDGVPPAQLMRETSKESTK